MRLLLHSVTSVGDRHLRKSWRKSLCSSVSNVLHVCKPPRLCTENLFLVYNERIGTVTVRNKFYRSVTFVPTNICDIIIFCRVERFTSMTISTDWSRCHSPGQDGDVEVLSETLNDQIEKDVQTEWMISCKLSTRTTERQPTHWNLVCDIR